MKNKKGTMSLWLKQHSIYTLPHFQEEIYRYRGKSTGLGDRISGFMI